MTHDVFTEILDKKILKNEIFTNSDFFKNQIILTKKSNNKKDSISLVIDAGLIFSSKNMGKEGHNSGFLIYLTRFSNFFD